MAGFAGAPFTLFCYLVEGEGTKLFPKAKKHASLMFHKGAEIPGTFPNLVGDGKEARSFKVADLAELESKSGELRSIFIAWCDLRDGV